jgi:tryptophanyl-tRNA synthetase
MANDLIFSGVQPSGAQVHLGNYLGAMRRFVELSQRERSIFCIVDLHALTSVADPKLLGAHTQSLAAAYLAIGLDPAKTILFRQSDVPEVTELSWILSCVFPLGLLERGHALKDARAKSENPNAGVMYYPILMAADILLYRATKVPVGADQKQHVEMTRDVAQKFNSAFAELFTLPEPLIDQETGVIPGLDGRKMSKSYDNYIGLFEPAKALRAKIMRIVTDSKTVEEVKDPEQCNVFRLFKLVSTSDQQCALAERYRAGGMGYGHAKQELFEAVERMVSPLRTAYDDWMKRPDDLREVLKAGAHRAREVAQQTMEAVRDAVGISRL